MWKKLKIKRRLAPAIAVMLLAVLIGFTEVGHRAATCTEVIIRIHNTIDNHFLNNQDVHNLMTKGGEEVLLGAPLKEINLKKMEERIQRSPYIKNAEVYKDLKGHILVEAVQHRPVARILRQHGPDVYLSEGGTLLPVSDKFTARVMLLSGSFFNTTSDLSFLENKGMDEIYQLAISISGDPFWRAQVAQMDIDRDGEILIYPQVTKQEIVFGKAVDTEEKLRKLKVFYKEILPQKGWNKYEKINVKFTGQVIAE